jgi:hypothetical protein
VSCIVIRFLDCANASSVDTYQPAITRVIAVASATVVTVGTRKIFSIAAIR